MARTRGTSCQYLIEIAMSSQVKRSFHSVSGTVMGGNSLVMFGGGSDTIEYYCLKTNTWKAWWDTGLYSIRNLFCTIFDNTLYFWNHLDEKVNFRIEKLICGDC